MFVLNSYPFFFLMIMKENVQMVAQISLYSPNSTKKPTLAGESRKKTKKIKRIRKITERVVAIRMEIKYAVVIFIPMVKY